MLLKLDEPLVIEDMQHTSADGVRRLHDLLLRGAIATADLHRKEFYDVEDCDSVFYIHICPNEKVLLLANWAKEGAPLHAQTASGLSMRSAV